MKKEAQMKILTGYAAEKTKENSIANSILNVVDGEQTPEAVRLQQESQARLKGTVGGVQALLNVQANVASGLATKEAGAAIIQEIFGFDLETAMRMIGDPEEQPINLPPASL
jgi:hypothetical protein